MAKNYKRGSDLKLYYMSGGSWGTPTWTEVQAVSDLDVSSNPDDIAFPVRGLGTGHKQGQTDPEITFTLHYDKGDASVIDLIDAMQDGTVVTLAVADGAIATGGTVYWKMECCLSGFQLTAPLQGPASFAVTARRHVDSDYLLTEVTVSA